MRLLGPTPFPRLNEVAAVVFLLGAIALGLILVSYHPTDPSWNTATASVEPRNLFGSFGSHVADLLFQFFGLASLTLPVFLLVLAWMWIRSRTIEAQPLKIAGFVLAVFSLSTLIALFPDLRLFGDRILAGGVLGMLWADLLTGFLNTTGTAMLVLTCALLALYMITSFSVER